MVNHVHRTYISTSMTATSAVSLVAMLRRSQNALNFFITIPPIGSLFRKLL